MVLKKIADIASKFIYYAAILDFETFLDRIEPVYL